MKKYQKLAGNLNQSIKADLSKVPEKDRAFMTDIQARLEKAIITGNTKEAMNCEEEILNYIKANGTTDTSNKS